MPTLKDIKAKNAQFAASARENAGRPRIRTPKGSVPEGEDSLDRPRGRNIVKPARKDRDSKVVGAGLSNNKLALGLIVFVVVGGVFFELMRFFL